MTEKLLGIGGKPGGCGEGQTSHIGLLSDDEQMALHINPAGQSAINARIILRNDKDSTPAPKLYLGSSIELYSF
jgi:hypothetical protein